MFAAYGAYPLGNPNRSPSSARPGYNTTSSLSAANRINQRPLDPIGQLPSSLYNSEDRFGSYDTSSFRNPRIHAQQGFSDNFMLGNNQAWSYNSGAATVNGAMGDVNRLRSSNRRGALPSVRGIPEISVSPSTPYGAADLLTCRIGPRCPTRLALAAKESPTGPVPAVLLRLRPHADERYEWRGRPSEQQIAVWRQF